MPTIGEFVEALAKDPALDTAFDERPRRTAKQFGLTDKQIEDDLNPKKPLVFRVKRG